MKLKIMVVAALFLIFMTAAASAAKIDPSAEQQTADPVIIPVSVSLTANGNMLDFRYRVADEEKASALLTHKNKPYLIIENDGTKTGVLKSPKVGSLRTTRPHQTGKVYFMLFGNPGKKLKAGDKVSIVIGDYRAEHLTVQ